MTFNAPFLGRHLAYTYEITDFIPAERLVMRTQPRDRFRWKTTYTWQHWSRLNLRQGEDGAIGLARIPQARGPLMTTAIRHANRTDLRKLRAILQAQ
jgi:hypothetical protein